MKYWPPVCGSGLILSSSSCLPELEIVNGPFTYTNHFHNVEQSHELGAIVGALFSIDDCATAYSTIRQWPAYQATPLISMTDIAAAAGVNTVYYKDESSRFGLGSFKALGGSYAIECL